LKLYMEDDPAPNPRRVRLFLAEKGLAIPEVRVPLRQGAHKSPEHLARNPLGQVPTLELDDGTCLSETVSICRYLEALHPEPPLFGRTALEQAQVDQWIRRVEFTLMTPVGMFWRHAHPLTARLLTQFKDFGESNRESVRRAMLWFDRQLSDGRPWLAGETYGMADIALLTTVDFATWIGLETPAEAGALQDWRRRAAERPGLTRAA
jgi:glutathione S-transferase